MKLTDRIRDYIKCPQLGSADYGRWGASTWEQRKLINELCDKCDMFENSADSFAKQNDILKAFIKTHHPEIEKINDITLDVVVKATDEQLRKKNKQLKEQLAIREKALELACKKFIRDEVGMLTDTELYDYFIEQAKESINNDNTN